ncbi:MAG: HI0933 family protein [Candidatus Moranbacteria bacterium GW2011_GWE2_47_10]|nr:MAG: HI0933 family protein [Candidatus Moranbacteria bacterium GW2011_GWE2_47_10]
MEKNKFEFDVAVVGGGPAGMMAALRAAEKGARVVLVEKKDFFGTKLLMTGGGRCNISQAESDLKKLAQSYKNGRFLLPALRKFGPEEFSRYFERLGVGLKVEKNGRVFPKSEKASDVVGTLRKRLLENGVNFFMESEVAEIGFSGSVIEKLVLKDGREVVAQNYVIATGGKSYPHSGSTGQGYGWAEKIGHTVAEPEPSLVPVKSEAEWLADLQGVSLSDAKVGAYQDGKKIFESQGEMLVAHFGLSGPMVLNISGKIRDLLKSGDVVLKVDLKPHMDAEKLDEVVRADLERNAGKKLANCLGDLFSEKVRDAVLKLSKIDTEKHAAKVSREERRKIVFLIKGLEVPVKELFGFDRAMVTSGGISTKEVDSKTMRSKKIDNLFFAGEVLDVDGPTGGYNLLACWSTGYAAGENSFRGF